MVAQFERLQERVINSSVSDKWFEAKSEWVVVGLEEDETVSSECVCGQENLRYLYTIKNIRNDNTLFPIGSHCINQFEEDALDAEVTTYRKLFELVQAVKDHKYIKLDSDHFSKKLLKYLYDNDVFVPNRWNKYDPYNDYKFMVDMFNSRRDPSDAQQRKINALILKTIIPFAKRKLENE